MKKNVIWKLRQGQINLRWAGLQSVKQYEFFIFNQVRKTYTCQMEKLNKLSEKKR